MKVSTILDHIDSGHMALPEFQRGYVWNRDQVRGLFDSLYRRHPVGGLLVWATESKTATHRGDGALAAGVVKLLLDGQQRMTSVYGVVRGRAPKFFDGNAQAFTGLRFHLETETFEFYQPMKMKGDPLWTDVTELMRKGTAGLGEFVTRLTEQPALAFKVGDYVGRLSRLLGIVDVDLHVEEVTGADKSLDVVVNIFNRVNSGGTKLSKGDLALAKISAEWPAGRDAMKAELKEWAKKTDYHFTLDWLLRSVTTVLTGEAKFQHLHEKSAAEVQNALARTTKHIERLRAADSAHQTVPEGRTVVDDRTVLAGLPVSDIGKSERATQNRVIALFRDELDYRFMGDWSDRANRQIEAGLLRGWLVNRGHTPEQIDRALDLLNREANNPTRSLYDNNPAVYSLLRYGVDVRVAAGENTEKIWLIDWQNPEVNDFAIAEEVTLTGAHERRPDLVLYVNGLAVGVIELKRSAVSIGDGIRQLISNQQPEFNAWFFSTVQIVFAGNDAEGLRYGTIGTPEKMFLAWKEDETDNTRYKLDKYLLKICAKLRLIELMRDFVLFDGGVKKLPRVHQYFGVKAAQQHARGYRGGIIWHTQGSGKSIVMVLLARWILENLPHARVLVITDREELDAQIERVFHGSGDTIYRTQSGADLIAQLGQAKPRLLCSLVHKFGQPGVADFGAFIEELQQRPSSAGFPIWSWYPAPQNRSGL